MPVSGPVPSDVALLARVASGAERALWELSSRVDILVNNAGIGHTSLPVAKLPYNAWKDVIDTNLNGTFLITREILPLMRRGGAIVNNLSIAATQVFANSSAYNASKHGALGL